MIAAATAAISSFIVVQQQPEIYQANTTIMVGNAITAPNPSSNQFYLAQLLAAAYADFTNRGQVAEAVKQQLELSVLPSYSARAVPNSQLLEISVVDTDPARAQAVANAFAEQLLLFSPSNGTSSDSQRDEFIAEQLDTLQTQIEAADAEIAELNEELGDLNSARQIAEVEAQIVTLESKRNQLQANFADLIANTREGAVNSLTIITPANLPVAPIGPRKLVTVGISALIGLSLALAAAYILEYLNGTIESIEDMESLLPFDVIGSIGSIREKDQIWSYVTSFPRSPITESFMNLVSSLELAQNGKDVRALLVSSSIQGEGKSVISMNLALTLARLGRKVILVDLDLRIPTLNEVYDLKDKKGLSDYLQDGSPVKEYLLDMDIPNFRILTSGTPYEGTNPLISSRKVDSLIKELKKEADIVVLDAPPLFMAETSYMLSKVDGALLVTRPGHTKKQPVKAMIKHLERINANIVGVVVNDITGQQFGYYGGYYGYANYANR